jgi:fluoride exporter
VSAAPAAPVNSEHPLAGLTILAVALGGGLGTLLRAAVDATLLQPVTQFATATLLVNVVGSAFLGVLVGWASPRVPGWARAGLGAGLLGSFTTYSAFALSVVLLTESGRLPHALMTVLLTLALGIGAAVVGFVLGARLVRGSRLEPDPWPEADE